MSEKRTVIERVVLSETTAEAVLSLAQQKGISRSATLRRLVETQLSKEGLLDAPEDTPDYRWRATPNPGRTTDG